MPMGKRAAAELFGTFWLVFGGCGSALLSMAAPNLGIGIHGVSIAFGLTVLTMAYAVGHISGCHLNPAVSLGLAVGKRFPMKEIPSYVGAQLGGAVLAAAILYFIATGKKGGFDTSIFAANGYGEHSPDGYGLPVAFVTEFVLTFMFLFVILGATDSRAPAGFAPIPIWLCLALIHLIGIPVTRVSVNPARSTGPALFADGWALEQLWLFWVAPPAGAALAGVVYPLVAEQEKR